VWFKGQGLLSVGALSSVPLAMIGSFLSTITLKAEVFFLVVLVLAAEKEKRYAKPSDFLLCMRKIHHTRHQFLTYMCTSV